jgi:hypothetical protein
MFLVHSRPKGGSRATGNEPLHDTSNSNVVRVINFALSRNLIVKSEAFLQCDIYKLIGRILMERPA